MLLYTVINHRTSTIFLNLIITERWLKDDSSPNPGQPEPCLVRWRKRCRGLLVSLTSINYLSIIYYLLLKVLPWTPGQFTLNLLLSLLYSLIAWLLEILSFILGRFTIAWLLDYSNDWLLDYLITSLFKVLPWTPGFVVNHYFHPFNDWLLDFLMTQNSAIVLSLFCLPLLDCLIAYIIDFLIASWIDCLIVSIIDFFPKICLLHCLITLLLDYLVICFTLISWSLDFWIKLLDNVIIWKLQLINYLSITWFDQNPKLWVKIEMTRSESTRMFGISVPGALFPYVRHWTKIMIVIHLYNHIQTYVIMTSHLSY